MKYQLMTLFILVTLIPIGSAEPWDVDNEDAEGAWDCEFDGGLMGRLYVDNIHSCWPRHLCLGFTPYTSDTNESLDRLTPVVDFVLYCMENAQANASFVVGWTPGYAQAYVWYAADNVSATAYQRYASAALVFNQNASPVNDLLCQYIWSEFCTRPLLVPTDLGADPIEESPF